MDITSGNFPPTRNGQCHPGEPAGNRQVRTAPFPIGRNKNVIC
ncbi:hypothetical protein L510_0948 [Bordetella bronchiseptica MBORD591]|nr:hypothetical protein L510_0948 [Bordetella bronchiseptica MBORD591]